MKKYYIALLVIMLSSVCSAQEFQLNGLKYRVIGKNDVAVIGIKKKSSNIVIPEQVAYNGLCLNVVEIGKKAFKGENIQSVELPKTLRTIQEYAFSQTQINKIIIPDSVSYIGDYAFHSFGEKLGRNFYCDGPLEEITLSSGLEYIGFRAFYFQGIKKITIPKRVKTIQTQAFLSCSNLKEVVFSEGVKNIGYEAFAHCTFLEKIVLPKTLYSIGERAFEWTRLNTILNYREGINIHESAFYFTPFEKRKIRKIPKGIGMNLRVEDDGTISYTFMPFSSFLKPKVEAEINIWQKKGEFESTEKWKGRVNETTRKAKIQELTSKYKQEYQALVKEYYSYVEQEKKESIDLSKLQLSAFDPDNESFMITGLPDADILLSVKTEDAPSFKKNWETIKKSASFEYVPNGNDVAIVSVTFTDGDKKYTYDGKSDVKYGVTDVEYNFKPLELAMEENIEYNFDALEGVPTTTVQSLTHNKTKVEHKKVSVGNVSDVDKTIPNTYTNNSNTFAVIIGNENYQKVSKVQFAGNDSGIFAQYCKLTLGLPDKNIRCYNDATYATMLSAVKDIKSIAQAYKGNLNVLFYYAGHGVPNESSNDAFLLPIDTDGRSTEVCYPLSKLYQELGSMNAKSVVVFMDACFSGAQRGEGMLASARGVAIMAKPAAPQGNMVVFSAASGDETAYPYKEKNHGLFTYFLLKKLQETKGNVTLGELGSYIIDNVTKESVVSNGKSQTPTVSTSMSLDDSWRELKLK